MVSKTGINQQFENKAIEANTAYLVTGYFTPQANDVNVAIRVEVNGVVYNQAQTLKWTTETFAAIIPPQNNPTSIQISAVNSSSITISAKWVILRLYKV